MKKHTLISMFWLFGSLCFAQKTQIWLGPTYNVIPKSVAQSSSVSSFTQTSISNKDTSYYNVINTFNRFDSLKFSTKISISAGIRWEKNLNTHFSLSYGIGLMHYKFNVVNKSSFGELISTVKTQITKPKPITSTNTNVITNFIRSNEKLKTGTDYAITELQIPLILNWRKADFSVGLGAQLSSPIAIKASSERFTFERVDENTFREVKQTVSSTNSTKIKRSSIDLCANYTQWIERLGLEIAVSRKMTNIWNDNSTVSLPSFSTTKEITTHKVNPIALSLRVIYMLK